MRYGHSVSRCRRERRLQLAAARLHCSTAMREEGTLHWASLDHCHSMIHTAHATVTVFAGLCQTDRLQVQRSAPLTTALQCVTHHS